jgi:outer membrane protein
MRRETTPMMRNALVILSAAALLLLGAGPKACAGSSAEGEEPSSGGPLTLATCLKTALHKSPGARSAEAAAAAAEQSAEAARAGYYPWLDFSAGASRWQRRIFLPNGIGLPGMKLPATVGPLDDYAVSLEAGYTIFDFGRRKALLGAARAGRNAAAARRQQTRQDIALEVIQAFYGLESAQQMRDVAQESLQRAQDHVRIAGQRKQAGAVPLIDLLRARTEASSAQLDLVRAEADVRLARGRLATSMGLSAETALSVEPAPNPVEPPDGKQLSAALDRAAASRPSVLAAEANVEAAQRGVSRARSTFGPTAVASASYGWEDTTWLPSDRVWSVGVGVAVPIFAGFSRVHELARARLELERAQADRDQAALAAREQAWDAFSSVRQAYEALQATEALVASARESHRLARERYQVGAGTLTDMLDAQTALAKAEATRVSDRAAYTVAVARYRWSIGEILPPER